MKLLRFAQSLIYIPSLWNIVLLTLCKSGFNENRGQLALLYATLLVHFWSKLYSKSLKPQTVPSEADEAKGGPKLGHPLRYHGTILSRTPIAKLSLWYHQ